MRINYSACARCIDECSIFSTVTYIPSDVSKILQFDKENKQQFGAIL